MKSPAWWTLNKILVLLLLGAFVGLTLDLRYEHVDKVRKFWEAWIPIVYSGAMVVLGAVCLRLWERGGRQILSIAFTFALAVGVVGFWLHNRGHLVSAVMQVLSAWTQPIRHKDVPPQLAPLAFVGLGVLGMMACAKRLQVTSASAT